MFFFFITMILYTNCQFSKPGKMETCVMKELEMID